MAQCCEAVDELTEEEIDDLTEEEETGE